jgi:hypothetical protein
MPLFQRLSRCSILKVTAVSIFALAPASVFATSISLTNGGRLFTFSSQEVVLSRTCIDFNAGVCLFPGSAPEAVVVPSDTTVFAQDSGGPIEDIPFAHALPIVDFETLYSPASVPIYFDLTSLVQPGASGNCTSYAVNATCSVAGMPFVFTQISANEISVTFEANEIAYTGTSASGSTPYLGVFSAEIGGDVHGDTIPNWVTYLNGGGTVFSNWQSTQTPVAPSATPEPSTFTYLLGPGLAGSIALLRRRQNPR